MNKTIKQQNSPGPPVKTIEKVNKNFPLHVSTSLCIYFDGFGWKRKNRTHTHSQKMLSESFSI